MGLLHGSISTPGHEFTSDASGAWGCEAWYGMSWFQHAWGRSAQDGDISAKELILVVITAAVWGPQWAGSEWVGPRRLIQESQALCRIMSVLMM